MAFKHFILCILQISAIYGQMSDDMSIMDIINATAQLSEVNSCFFKKKSSKHKSSFFMM